jgi:hypothetical protein
MAHEQNDLGGGHSPRELDIPSGTFVADSVASVPATDSDRDAAGQRERTASKVADRPERGRNYGFLTFVGIAVYLGWRFLTDARISG